MKTLTIGDLKPRFPIIQGGMGVGISLSGLASAVANEGGIGVISAAGLGLLYKKLSPNYTEAGNLGLAEEIRKAREKAKGIIGVNVMVALSDFAELVKTSIAEKVDIIFSGAGLPLDLPSFLKKDSVTKLVPIVSSARAVRIICEKWKNNYDYLPRRCRAGRSESRRSPRLQGKPAGRRTFLTGRVTASGSTRSFSLRREIQQEYPGNCSRRHLYG